MDAGSPVAAFTVNATSRSSRHCSLELSRWRARTQMRQGISECHVTRILQGLLGLMIILHEARGDLRMATIGPLNTAIGQDLDFDYFDEIRKVIFLASANLLFVDQHLDVDFVSRYLPLVKPGVAIRLLAREKLATWGPAAKLFRGNLSCDLRQVFTTAIYLLTGRRATSPEHHLKTATEHHNHHTDRGRFFRCPTDLRGSLAAREAGTGARRRPTSGH
jgi:hypothetical protein